MMPSPGRVDRVAPVNSSWPGPSIDDPSTLPYELLPAYELPVVDFSVSLRSRFLSESWLSITTSWLSHGRVLFCAFTLGIIILLAMLLLPKNGLAEGLAVLSAALQLPSYLITMSVLRYEMVGLLVKTYDFWFFFLYTVAFVVSEPSARTAAPWLVNLVMRSALAKAIVRTSGASAFVLTIVAALLADYRRNDTAPHPFPPVQSLATGISSMFVLATGVRFLRQTHDYFVSCFDFIIVSWQLSLTRFVTCDYFQWRTRPCLVVFMSWMWIHWAMCIDELSPLVKDTFRVHRRFPAVVVLTGLVGYCVLLYGMVVLDQSEKPYDRVLRHGAVLGNPVAFRVLPLFYSSFLDLAAWLLRLLYRQLTFDTGMTTVVDGPVAYTNYMRERRRQTGEPRRRFVSRQWTPGPPTVQQQ